MKKRDKKLELHRETVHRLSHREMDAARLAQARGGAVAAAAETGVWTSCIQPNCCGDTITQGTA
ncbi:MAG: hypothetical protein DMF53_16920 [Acidobacteria bacterium]|nr:MAG: hypothetical protein DMF53_16920 [Acidobacteriota bacterium]